MASFVSLETAKDHLRIPQDDSSRDADLSLKLDQAVGIVLDYLKARPISIASVSVANPTVITTSVPHSLTSGTTYTIAGATTTPTVNGSQVVTVTGATTFTVPVNVTVGQSVAAGTVGSPVWTEGTVPGPVLAAVLHMLAHLYEHRDDMAADVNVWEAIGRVLGRLRDPALA